MLKEDCPWPEHVAEQIETRMVNAGTRSSVSFPGTNIDMSLIFNEKIYRAEYITLQNSLVESLTRVAVQLKEIDRTARGVALRNFIAERNRWLEQHIQAKKIDLNSKYSPSLDLGTAATIEGLCCRWKWEMTQTRR